jgi:hypothetical protein
MQGNQTLFTFLTQSCSGVPITRWFLVTFKKN